MGASGYVLVMDMSRLTAFSLFADLPEDDLAKLAGVAVEIEAGAGEQLATQGDLGHAMSPLNAAPSTSASMAGSWPPSDRGRCSARWQSSAPASVWRR